MQFFKHYLWKIKLYSTIFRIIKKNITKYIDFKEIYDKQLKIQCAIFYTLYVINNSKFIKFKKELKHSIFYKELAKISKDKNISSLSKKYLDLFLKIQNGIQDIEKINSFLVLLVELFVQSEKVTFFTIKNKTIKKYLCQNIEHEKKEFILYLDILAKLNSCMKITFPNRTNDLSVFINRIVKATSKHRN